MGEMTEDRLVQQTVANYFHDKLKWDSDHFILSLLYIISRKWFLRPSEQNRIQYEKETRQIGDAGPGLYPEA